MEWPFLIILLLSGLLERIKSFGEIMNPDCPWPCNCTQDSSIFLVNCSSRELINLNFSFPTDATDLLLDNNNLTHLPKGCFKSSVNLRTLNLSSNFISRLETDSFQGLSNLTELDLTNNNLSLSTWSYPHKVFRDLLVLKTLYLNNNSRSLNVQSSGKLCHEPSHYMLSNEISNTTQSSFPSMIDVESSFKYPDAALSLLVNLGELHIDGLPNTTFGSGFRKLTKLTSLQLNGNSLFCSLDSVTNKTFANVPHLEYLNLADCNIKVIEAGAFSMLENLTWLDLSLNEDLGFDRLGNAFYGLIKTRLREIIINSIVPKWSSGVRINSTHLRYFRNLSFLQTVVVGYNRIETFEPGVLCDHLPASLENVYLYGNPLSLSCYVKDASCIRYVKFLDVSGFNSSKAPKFKFPDFTLICPNDSVQSAENSVPREHCKVINPKDEFVLPPNLEHLILNYFGLFNRLEYIPVNSNNSLLSLSANGNYFSTFQGQVKGLDKLQKLYLKNVNCMHIEKSFFDRFPNLEVLDISGNSLKDVIHSDTNESIFQGLKSLKRLQLSRNYFGPIPEAIFAYLSNLETLDMSRCGIGAFTPVISHMKNLSLLNLSFNLINRLPPSTCAHLNSLAETQNITLDLRNNPIICGCQNLDFLKWMRDTKVKKYDFEINEINANYYCLEADGLLQPVANYDDVVRRLEYQCENYVGTLVGASSVSIILLAVVSFALIYRFRWKLRYAYYATRLRFQRQASLNADCFKFDAFVSLDSDDTSFVREMRLQLEGRLNLKLCINTRDFPLGHYMVTCVVDAVQRSRHTLIVLTRALLEYEWCNYELQMALMENVHTGRDVVIFLLYENIPMHELPREILFNIQSHTYLEFPHKETNRDPFWNRLAEILRN